MYLFQHTVLYRELVGRARAIPCRTAAVNSLPLDYLLRLIAVTVEYMLPLP